MTDQIAALQAREDSRSWRDEFRSLIGGVNVVVLVAAIAAGVWGIFDSMTDADGDRFAGNLVVAAPGIYAGWCMLEVAWRRVVSMGTVLFRLVSSCFVAPALVALPMGVVQAVAVAFPDVQQAIADTQARNGGFHYYWSEGIASQLFLVPLGGYVVGMCIPLAVALIVVLPVVAIRAPQIAAQGSHLEKVGAHERDSTTAFVFVGLGATVLGIILWVFADGGSILDFPEGVGRVFRSLSYGRIYWDDLIWPLGVVLVVAGVLLMAWGCARVLFARGRAARG